MKKMNDQILVIGSSVYCILYGGRDGIVFAIHGEQAPGSVVQMGGGLMSRGGNAAFDIVFSNGDVARAVPESIVRGVQWRLLDGIANGEEIATAIAHAAIVKAEKQTKEQESKAAFQAVVIALRTDSQYAHLMQGDDSHSGKLAAANIRSILKRKFPGIKFSVRKTDYGCVRVNWVDGPTVKDVEAIANRFESGSFNGMEDIYEYRETPFNVVFGGCKYLSCSREASPELITRAIEQVCKRYGIDTDKPTADDFKMGRLWSAHVGNASHDLQSLIHRALAEMSA